MGFGLCDKFLVNMRIHIRLHVGGYWAANETMVVKQDAVGLILKNQLSVCLTGHNKLKCKLPFVPKPPNMPAGRPSKKQKTTTYLDESTELGETTELGSF